MKSHAEILRQLIALRNARGLKQATIARRIHVTRPYVSMIERGRRRLTVPMMIGYAHAVGAEICVVDKGHQTGAVDPVLARDDEADYELRAKRGSERCRRALAQGELA